MEDRNKYYCWTPPYANEARVARRRVVHGHFRISHVPSDSQLDPEKIHSYLEHPNVLQGGGSYIEISESLMFRAIRELTSRRYIPTGKTESQNVFTGEGSYIEISESLVFRAMRTNNVPATPH